MTNLEMTREQFLVLKEFPEDFCLIKGYQRKEDDVITRAWIDSIGNEEEIREIADTPEFVIVPTGLTIFHQIMQNKEILECPIKA